MCVRVLCAAGVTGPKGHPLEMKDSVRQEAWDTDFMSVIRTLRAYVPAMERKDWGRVVIICSENAVHPDADEAVYSIAKSGLLNFAKGLSRVTALNGVLVDTVSPAFIEASMTDGMMDKRAERKGTDREEAIRTFLDEERRNIAPKRRGKPEEIAAIIAFLYSDHASFDIGSNYRVDGGSVATMST